MVANNTTPKKTSLKEYGIENTIIRYNLSPEKLHEICLEKGLGKEANSGALAVNTGEFTGRSPKDRFIVKDELTKDIVWWGDINIPFEEEAFNKLYSKITKHLSNKELYVREAYACADARYKMNLRIITELPWVNLFAYNMFLRPTNEDLKKFTPEWIIIQAPSFMAIPAEDGTR